MAITYTPIATTTLSSAASSITFSSISASYTDLILVCSLINVSTGGVTVRFNGDSGSNYSRAAIYGSGASVGYVQNASQTLAYLTGNADPTSTVPNIIVADIPLYSNTNKFKNILLRSGAATGSGLDLIANTWRNTAAINSIQIFNSSSNNFAIGSVFTLYQITAAA